MKTVQENINQWLKQEAHIVAGHAFRANDFSCIPVWHETSAGANHEPPKGFLMTQGNEVGYFDAHSPQGEQLCHAWQKHHLNEILAEHDVPAECWFG